MRTRVKFCGISAAADAAAAARAGADAIGFVFYAPAAAAVTAAQAAAAAAALPPFVQTVALFVDAPAREVFAVQKTLRPHLLQFHGDETREFCAQFAQPYIKACRVRGAADITNTARAHPNCAALLLDAYVENRPGGTGQQFDWSHIPRAAAADNSPPQPPLIIAGGLTAENVGALIRAARPWAVDVSGGICEDTNRRRKNWDKMTAFIRSVRHADASDDASNCSGGGDMKNAYHHHTSMAAQ